jgi:HYR domain-containing protein
VLSMHTLRRAGAAAMAMTLLAAGSALADFVPLDADHINAGVVDLGAVEPGAVLTETVRFELVCSGFRHADPGQTVLLHQGMTVVPDPDLFGGSISATDATIGPVPDTWANDTHGSVICPQPIARLAANESSTVTIVAPFAEGTDYELTVFFDKVLTPPGVNDASSVAGVTAVTYRLDVVEAPDLDTTPPVLHDVPTGIDLATTDPAGALLHYTPPTATDDRDPAPTVGCVPAPGSLAPVGASEVTCTATDASGNTSSASFPVMVHLASALWEEPVGNGGTLMVHGQRTVPVKVQAWLDGVEVTTGSPSLVVEPCGATPGSTVEQVMPVEFSSGRWTGHLSTGDLPAGCHRVSLVADGTSLGSFMLSLDTATATKARGQKPR